MNLTTLREDVLETVHHEKADTRFADILRYAEARIRRDVLDSTIERSEYGFVSTPIIELPDDINVIQRLVLYREGREVSTPVQAPGPVERNTNAVGVPRTYNKLDQVLMLYPSPDMQYEYALYYIPVVRPLTITNPTNWVLDTAPDIYLYGCCHRASVMIEDFEKAMAYDAMYVEAWSRYNSQSMRMKYPMNTPVRIRMKPAA